MKRVSVNRRRRDRLQARRRRRAAQHDVAGQIGFGVRLPDQADRALASPGAQALRRRRRERVDQRHARRRGGLALDRQLADVSTARTA